MTDEEFLNLAWECEATRVAYPDPQCWVGSVAFGDVDFLTLCREIERRALEMAAEMCDEYGEEKWQAYKLSPTNHPDRANPHVEGQADGAVDCAIAIRAMIKEKE